MGRSLKGKGTALFSLLVLRDQYVTAIPCNNCVEGLCMTAKWNRRSDADSAMQNAARKGSKTRNTLGIHFEIPGKTPGKHLILTAVSRSEISASVESKASFKGVLHVFSMRSRKFKTLRDYHRCGRTISA